jgi:hypothetical protein
MNRTNVPVLYRLAKYATSYVRVQTYELNALDAPLETAYSKRAVFCDRLPFEGGPFRLSLLR